MKKAIAFVVCLTSVVPAFAKKPVAKATPVPTSQNHGPINPLAPKGFKCPRHGNIGTSIFQMFGINYCAVCFKEMVDSKVYQVVEDQTVTPDKK